MYFSKLLLKDFGKFHNREINLKPGVNVVYGTRNAGKSTVADFEYATLYGICDKGWRRVSGGAQLPQAQYDDAGLKCEEWSCWQAQAQEQLV